jgi:hypothetical protein
MLAAMLQHVFDPPPDSLAVPRTFLAALAAAALAGRSPPVGQRCAACAASRSDRFCASNTFDRTWSFLEADELRSPQP